MGIDPGVSRLGGEIVSHNTTDARRCVFQRIYERIDEDVREDQNDGDVIERICELDATQLQHNEVTKVRISENEWTINRTRFWRTICKDKDGQWTHIHAVHTPTQIQTNNLIIQLARWNDKRICIWQRMECQLVSAITRLHAANLRYQP